MSYLKKSVGFMILLLSLVSMGAGPSQEFSADMTTRTSGQETQAKFYSGGNKTRTEMPDAIVVTRLDRMVTYIWTAGQNMYMEQPVNPNIVAQTSTNLPGEIERKSMGKEDVNGKNTEKFLISYDAGGGQQNIYQWIGPEGLPIKTSSENGEWTVEYQNIQIGAQPADLFEPPVGYQKMVMPDLSGMLSQSLPDETTQ